jgi:glycine amidinotransferase
MTTKPQLPTNPVHAYTEWGTLKEIIVGNCVHLTRENIDLSFKLFYAENLKDQLIENSIKLQERIIAQRMEDLDHMAATLRKEGIVVHRPLPINEVKPFATPHFSSHTTPADNPRDQVLIWGDRILETAPLLRTRYFENDLFKPLFKAYFRNGSRWSCAPRPLMTDDSFADSKHARAEKIEIMFDAAQCLRFGTDILMNVSNENHELGFQWLSRELKGEAKIHKVSLTDNHIDSMLMPLRPGLLLINPTTMKDKLHLLPKKLQKWDILEVPTLAQEHKNSNKDVLLASANIYTNVLPLSEKKVMVFAHNLEEITPLIDLLAKNGIEPLPIRLRHSRLFGGGAHCVTLDTIREDKPQSFL